MQKLLRSIPSVDKSIKAILEMEPSFQYAPFAFLKNLVKEFWDNKREAIRAGKDVDMNTTSLLQALVEFVKKGMSSNLRRVINATGIIVHTNLGRSPLPSQACDAVAMAASGYCNLEMNLENGKRGGRNDLTRDLICKLTESEDALVVNNNAAAVLLVLDTICVGGETIVSRGELVEIGGSFRIPDIMCKSGTILREVGTTNRTHPYDYLYAINEQTKAIMRVHTSNFRISGFHSAVPLTELKKIALEANLPLLVDLGSGSLLDLKKYGLSPEPVVKDVLAQGADIVCFSGDKVLGGPQAGIIAGKALLIQKLKKNPLSRTLRCDKLCLAALEATLRIYLDPKLAIQKIPTLHMITKKPEEVKAEARSLARKLRKTFADIGIECDISLIAADSRIGGGSFPEFQLATTLVRLLPARISPESLRKRLLEAEIPVIGRMEKDAFCLDPRTIEIKNYPILVNMIAQALEKE